MSIFYSSESKKGVVIAEWVLLILLVLSYYLWLSQDAIYSASENGRMLDRFETDEYQLFSVTKDALLGRTFYLDWSVYGHFYLNLALLPLVIKDLAGTVSDQFIILTMRYISLLSSALTVILSFSIARRYFHKAAAWISAVLLAVVPSIFNYWSLKIHPDTLQVLLVVASLFSCGELLVSRKTKWLFLASVFAGMAFSTKYVGVFLLPVIWFFYLLSLNTGRGKDFSFTIPNLRAWIKNCMLTGVLFIIAFVVTSPGIFAGGLFFEGLSIQMEITRAGHIFAANHRAYEWFSILSSSPLLGRVNSLILVAALIWFLVDLWKSRLQAIFSIKGLLWTWVLFYFTYALLNVNLREGRYLLVILPPAFILVSQFLVDLIRWTRKNTSILAVFYFLVITFLMLEGLEVLKGIANQRSLIESTLKREVNDPVIEAGLWLEENYPPKTRILYDRYSYVPPVFDRVQGSYGMDLQMLLEFNPRVVIINPAIRDIYLDPNLASSFVEGKEKYMAIHDFYEQMEDEMLGYHLVRDFHGFLIFERKKK